MSVRPDVLIRWIFSTQAGTLIVLVPMGPDNCGPRSEEWVIHLNYPADDPRAQSDAQVEADDIRVYQPGTRPGAPLPHAWIDDEDGVRRAIKDLVQPGRFLLIAGEDGGPWCQAARELAGQTGLPLDAVRIGHLDGDLLDPRCTWLRHREITSEGALLVRPDRFIGWRHAAMAPDPRAELARVLSHILGRQLAQARPAPGSAARPGAKGSSGPAD